MIPKQDRTHVRTASQLEQKYEFGQDLTELTKTAKRASADAASAKATADSLDGRVSALEQSGGGGTGLGLSIVNGLLCITYKG